MRGAAEPLTVVIKRSREGLGCAAEAAPHSSSAASNGVDTEARLQDFRLSMGAELRG